MKDNLSLAIAAIALGLVAWGAYDAITEVNNYNDGQGYVMLGIGVVMLIVLFFFKKNDKPGR
jgi:hypothetical protein